MKESISAMTRSKVPKGRDRPVESAMNATASAPAAPRERLSACPCGGTCPRCGAAGARMLAPPPLQADDVKALPPGMRSVLGEGGVAMPEPARSRMEGAFGKSPTAAVTADAAAPRTGARTGWTIGAPESAIERNADEVARAVARPAEECTPARGGGVDLSAVRVHTGGKVDRALRPVNARAMAVGPRLLFASGEFSPHSTRGDALLAHEIAHSLQQAAGGNARIDRSLQAWLTGTPNVRGMSYTALLSDIDELAQWSQNQMESNEETARIAEALRVLRQEAGRREAQARGPRRASGQSRESTGPAQQPGPTRPPRILMERSSVVYADTEDMRAEFDLVMEWLARGDITARERELLRLERQTLEPQVHRDRAQVVAQRQAARLQLAFTPTSRDAANALEHAARIIAGISQDPRNPEQYYVYHRNERVPIARAQAERLRTDIRNELRRARQGLVNRVEYYWGRYTAQVEINLDSPGVAWVASILGGVDDPGDELIARRNAMFGELERLGAAIYEGRIIDAAAMLPSIEQEGQVIRTLARAYYEGLIEGAELARTVLEFTRDASFAIAGSIAAVVAAPVVAGAAGGLGLTGFGAGAFTTVGTGLVVGTGTATARGGSAAVGEGFAGSSREQITEAFWGEAGRGFREGFLAGAGGGAARALGAALGLGTQVSGEVLRRMLAEALVNGTSAMVDTLWRRGTVEEAVRAGVQAAALSIPGAVVGSSQSAWMRELGGPLAAGATAYLGAIASGAPQRDAMLAAGQAVASNALLNRVQHGSEQDADYEEFGRGLGERARGAVSPTPDVSPEPGPGPLLALPRQETPDPTATPLVAGEESADVSTTSRSQVPDADEGVDVDPTEGTQRGQRSPSSEDELVFIDRGALDEALESGPGEAFPESQSPRSMQAAFEAGLPPEVYQSGTVYTGDDFPDLVALAPIRGSSEAPAVLPREQELQRGIAGEFPTTRPDPADVQHTEFRADFQMMEEALVAAGAEISEVAINRRQRGGAPDDPRSVSATARPDFQLSFIDAELNGRRIVIEYDRAPGTRAMEHATQILERDSEAIVIIKIVGFEGHR